jgi:hypothetical protein
MVPLAVAQHGWQLTSSRTTPGLQEAADAEGSSIEWGELLGAWQRWQQLVVKGYCLAGVGCTGCGVAVAAWNEID